MTTYIRISHPDGKENVLPYEEDYGSPQCHMIGIMENMFPDSEIMTEGSSAWIESEDVTACVFEADPDA